MKSTLMSSLQSVIRVMIKFLLTFSETNFMKLPKATKFVKFVALKKAPQGTAETQLFTSLNSLNNPDSW